MSVFGLALHSWEQLMLLALALAGLIALAVFVTTASVVILQRRENVETKREYDAYKLKVDAKVADAKREGIAAGEKAGNAIVRAAALEKEAQELKAKNLELEAKVRARRLSGDDTAKLTTALLQIDPRPIGIVSRLFDPEGADFADDLSNAFNGAHWQAVRQRDWTMTNRGVALATFEGTAMPSDLQRALLAALDASNVKATVITIRQNEQNTTSAHFQPEVLYLLVGAKPQ
jgi:hypothetical protein